ncbi:TonB-dependent receptor [Mucilaginibacter sp.]|uniref:TonB-dependent receptor n=1 Tax=Mucilaginibacter sp. TaxID=1882438 RepID=UPI003266A175
MKLTLLLIAAFILQVHANGFGQNVSLNVSNTPLEKVFKEISKQTGYGFLYSDKQLRQAPMVNLTLNNVTLTEALDKVLANQQITYTINQNTIILKKGPVAEKVIVTIAGKVIDEQGQPLPGVNVKLKGASTGTSTDVNGKFTINIPDKNSALEFSFIGYTTKTVTLNGQSTINVQLAPEPKSLNEVVVVGYGTQKRANLTGAVATVSGVELNKRVATSPTQLLQGQLPGMQVTQASGEAGNEGTALRVRGLGSYGAANDPLVIIDGIPGNLNALDPQNIASVTLLKDAASAAIYGTRAANGVILVTTKQGENGKFKLSYDYNIGVTSATKLPDFVYNSVQYMQMYNQAATNSGSPLQFTQAQIDAYANSTDRNQYPNYNWLNEVIQTVNVQTHHLGLTGGSNGTTYNIGLGYVNQPDIMIGFSYKKYNVQINLNSKVNERVTIGTGITFNYGQRIYPRQGSQDQFLSTLSQSPLYGPVLPDGSGRYSASAYTFQSPNKNPVAIAQNALASNNDAYLQGNVFVNVNIVKGLDWKTSGGLNYDSQKTYDYKPVVNLYYWFNGVNTPAGPNDAPARTLDVGGQGLTVTDGNYIYPVAFSQLTYNKKIKDHQFTLLAGTQAEYNKTQSLSASRVIFPNNSVQEINAGGAGAQSNTGTASEWSLYSFYGRFNYDYKGKYLLEASARDDGSSKFAPGNKWGVFPSASVGWRISRESFFEKLLPVVSDLKLRASLGKLGNQNITSSGSPNNYPYQVVYQTGNPYPFSSSTLSDGARQNTLANQDIQWETTNVFDLGTDISLLNGRLNLTFDWYKKMTSGILLAQVIPSYIGLTPPVVNSGKMQNTGFEISAQYTDHIGDFKYSVIGNLQANKNKLVTFGAPVIGSTTIIQEGLPYGSFYLYQYEGVFQSAAEIAASPTQQYSPIPGTLKFKDANADGKVDANDRIVVPGVFPDFDYSFNTSFAYKAFDLSVFLYGSHGQKQYVNGWGEQPFNQGSVPTTDWLNAWTPTNPSTTLPLIYLTGTGLVSNNISTVSTYYLKDASFLRIKNIQFGYNVPAKWAKHIAMSSLRVYFAGENLFTFSQYPGLDPERIVSNTRYVTHPQNKVFNFGVQAGF